MALLGDRREPAHAPSPAERALEHDHACPSSVCSTSTRSISALHQRQARDRGCVPRGARQRPWSRTVDADAAGRRTSPRRRTTRRPGRYACSTAFAHASWHGDGDVVDLVLGRRLGTQPASQDAGGRRRATRVPPASRRCSRSGGGGTRAAMTAMSSGRCSGTSRSTIAVHSGVDARVPRGDARAGAPGPRRSTGRATRPGRRCRGRRSNRSGTGARRCGSAASVDVPSATPPASGRKRRARRPDRSRAAAGGRR